MKVTLLGYTQPLITEPELAIQHNTATFLIEGISRSASHQIVRHRLASISQESQRYVSLTKGGWGVVIPPSIAEKPEAKRIMDEVWENLTKAYGDLRSLGIRKEDARFLLPNATETRMVISMNFAAWRHFCWLRCDQAAQWEVRAVAYDILQHLYELVPSAFQDLYDTFYGTSDEP
ncbi:MAG: FAD-dependent thymidylate synthase [Anaerolineae bacterium]|nr:FAD-dependent thymidylate synthase [Anaerolineae bacterium]